MSVRIILVCLAVMSAAFRIPAREKDYRRVCRSIIDCQACLSMPHCYAAYGLAFQCQQYPLPSELELNSTIIVDVPSCCPTSAGFHPQKCGFGRSSVDKNYISVIIWAAVFIGLTTALAVVITILDAVVKSCKKKRGIPNVSASAPTTTPAVLTPSQVIETVNPAGPSITTLAPSAHLPAPTHHKTDQKRQHTKDLSELLHAELEATASANWKRRRDSLKSHPLDQSRV